MGIFLRARAVRRGVVGGADGYQTGRADFKTDRRDAVIRCAPVPRRLRSPLTTTPVVLALAAWACTRADLFGTRDEASLPDKITLSGTLCSDDPQQRRLPVKVVFVVDGSAFGSTATGGQVGTFKRNALVDVFQQHAGAAEVEFAVVKYDGDTSSPTTDGFTKDPLVLNQAATQAATPCTGADMARCQQRRFELALERADNLVTSDLLSSDMGTRSRTRYVVVLYAEGPRVGDAAAQPVDAGPGLDAGAPDPDVYYCASTCLPPPGGFTRCPGFSPPCDDGCTFERTVHGMRDFVRSQGGADLVVHAAHFVPTAPPSTDGGACCGTGAPDDACDAQTTLARIAAAGGGRYLQYRNLGEINFRAFEYGASGNAFVMKSLVAVNLNALPATGGVRVDSDADGLSDDDEVARSLNPLSPDTDGDQLSDRLETVLQSLDLDPRRADQPLACGTLRRTAQGRFLDRDGDGLNDCEETLLGTDPTLFDTDADGFPDLVEFLYGTNYLVDDTGVDTDQDGARNGEELRQHSDPRSNDARTRGDLAYLYRVIVEDDGLGNGLSRVLDIQQPRALAGVAVRHVTPRVYPGVATLRWTASARTLEFRDNFGGAAFGPAVRVDERRSYVLHASGSVAGDALRERSITVDVTPQLMPPNDVPETLQVRESLRQCIDWRIRNITLVHTAPSSLVDQFRSVALPANSREGLNRILLYYGEAPVDRPQSPGLFRVAQVPMVFIPPRYKSPDVAEEPVADADFVLAGETAGAP